MFTRVHVCAHTYILIKINLKDNNNNNSGLNHHGSVTWNQDSITMLVVHWLCSRVPGFTSLSPNFPSIEEDNVSWLFDETTGYKVCGRAEQCDSLQKVLREQRFSRIMYKDRLLFKEWLLSWEWSCIPVPQCLEAPVGDAGSESAWAAQQDLIQKKRMRSKNRKTGKTKRKMFKTVSESRYRLA